MDIQSRNNQSWASTVHAPEGRQIGFGNLKFGVEQGAVNVNGDEAEGIVGHSQF